MNNKGRIILLRLTKVVKFDYCTINQENLSWKVVDVIDLFTIYYTSEVMSEKRQLRVITFIAFKRILVTISTPVFGLVTLLLERTL